MDKSKVNNVVDETQLSDLLKKTGPREAPSAELSQEVKANVKLIWQQEVKKNKRMLQRRYAIAAGLVFAISSVVLVNFFSKPEFYATVSKVVNQVEYQRQGGSWYNLDGGPVTGRVTIRTGMNSFASINMNNGLNVRISENSQIELLAIDEVTANSGIVFVNTQSSLNPGNVITISTPFGEVKDIGTQFQVKITPIDWQIQVREGQVEINDGAEQHFASKNERIAISADDSVQVTEISSDDASWEWTQEVSSAFDLEGSRLSEFLNWVGIETGKEIEYQSEIARISAHLTILHGSVEGLKPIDSLATVLMTTDFHLVETETDSIVVDK